MLPPRTLLFFVLSGISVFAQIPAVLKPCPAGTTVPVVRNDPNFRPPRPLSFRDVDPGNLKPNSLDHLAFFTIPANGIPCDIRLIGDASLHRQISAALADARFAAATLNNQPIATRASLAMRGSAGASPPARTSPDYEVAIRQVNSKDAQEQSLGVQRLETLSASKFPPADSYLGLMLLTGTRIAKDTARGLSLAQRAAAVDDRFGHYVMGMIFEKGVAQPKDEAAAIRHYSRAARFGMPLAYESLARLHESSDLNFALAHYRHCAGLGSGSCAATLATLLAKSPASEPEALAWGIVAQSRGGDTAALVERLRSALPAAQRAGAEQWADILLNTRPAR